MARLIINNKGIATVLAISIMIFIASIAVAIDLFLILTIY